MTKSYSSGVISLLPLFYVGWSDSVLGPSERKLIMENINSMNHLNNDEKKLLISWTDQANPPSPEVFKSWIQHIKIYSQDLDLDQKDDLISLGIAMAEKSGLTKNKHSFSTEDVVSSLESLEKTLGIDDRLNSKLLFHTIDPDNYTNISSNHNVKAKDLAKIIDGENLDFKNSIKRLLSDDFFLNKDERIKESYREKILAQCKELSHQGLSTYPFPEVYGGKNDQKKSLVVFEALAYGDLSLLIKFGVQFGLFGGAINMLGTEKHFRKFVNPLINLDLAGCFAMTETGHGSNVKGLLTTATYNQKNDSLVIHSPEEMAGKEYIGNALHAHMAAVFAQLIVAGENHGVHAILVPIRDAGMNVLPGIRIEDNGYKMGLNGVDNGKIWFDQVEVPRENLLDKYGQITPDGNYKSEIKNPSKRFFTMLGALVAGRVSIAFAGNTAAKSALNIAIRYGLKRRQFSQTENTEETLILDYPNHQHRLFPKLAKTYAIHFALEALRNLYAENFKSGDMRKVEALAAGMKAIASWHSTDVIQECREACGGKGYLSENGFSDLKADTDIFTTFEGDNNVLLQLVAKSLLTTFKENFQDGGFMSIVRLLTEKVSTGIVDLNPYTIRNTSAEHLLDHEFHLAALEYRENSLLQSLATRMRNYIKRRLNPNETYQLVQVHMKELAIASIENYLAKQIYLVVDTIQNEDEKVLIRRMARLYALDTIYCNRAWFLENDYMTASKSKAIRKQISNICQKIRPDARLYVDAFMIPDKLLKSEII